MTGERGDILRMIWVYHEACPPLAGHPSKISGQVQARKWDIDFIGQSLLKPIRLFIETLGAHAVGHRQIAIENDGLAAHTDNDILWRERMG